MVIGLSAACTKKYQAPSTIEPSTVSPFSPPPSAPTAKDQLDNLFHGLCSTPETKCVTAGIAQTVTFSKGTIVTLYPNSFKDKNGLTITSGTVCISMVEMYKPGDMIANRATTLSTAGILHSGGQVYITATKDGQKVYANKYGLAFKQAAFSTETMSLYTGSAPAADSLISWGKPGTDPGTTAAGTTDTGVAGPGFYYVFDSCSTLGWTNCDQLHDNTVPRTNVKVIPDDTLVSRWSTTCLIVLHDINAVVPFDEYDPIAHVFNLSSTWVGHQVPIGMSASIVVINTRKDGSVYYYEQKGLTTYDGMSLNVSLAKISPEQLKVKLSEL